MWVILFLTATVTIGVILLVNANGDEKPKTIEVINGGLYYDGIKISSVGEFTIPLDQWNEIQGWLDDQDALEIEKMLNSDDPIKRELAEDGMPYYGAIGVSATYSFTPTSLGTIVSVTHANGEKFTPPTQFEDF